MVESRAIIAVSLIKFTKKRCILKSRTQRFFCAYKTYPDISTHETERSPAGCRASFQNYCNTVEHWPCIRTSSVIERPNRGTRCRIHVVRTFPNGNSALTLPRAMPHHVADIHSSNSKHINIKPLVTSTLHIRILHLLGERCPYQYARNDKQARAF